MAVPTHRWTYEVKWKGAYKNTYEPASCLIGWEKEMRAVDEACKRRTLLPKVNPFVEAQRAREAKAKQKTEELQKRKARLQRLQWRRAMLHGDSGSEDDEMNDDGEDATADEEALGPEALTAELTKVEELLTMLAGGNAAAAAANAAAAGNAVDESDWLALLEWGRASTSALDARWCGRRSIARLVAAICRTRVMLAVCAARRLEMAPVRVGTSLTWRRCTTTSGFTSR